MTHDPSRPGSSLPGGPPPTPQRDAVYRLIQKLMIADMVVGAALIVAGLMLGPWPALVLLGAGLGLIGGGLFLFFRGLARQAAARQSRSAAGPGTRP